MTQAVTFCKMQTKDVNTTDPVLECQLKDMRVTAVSCKNSFFFKNDTHTFRFLPRRKVEDDREEE